MLGAAATESSSSVGTWTTGRPSSRDETTLEGPNHLGPFLHWLLWKRPELNVYLLKSNLRLLPAFDGFWFGVAPVQSAQPIHLGENAFRG